jgi:hypothetical protein
MRPLIFDMLYRDDRMFVLEISRVSVNGMPQWAVITRRNVLGYPPTRSDIFQSQEEAISYFNRIAPETPRVSLGNRPPNPIPTLEQYLKWLKSEALYDPVLNPEAPVRDEKKGDAR